MSEALEQAKASMRAATERTLRGKEVEDWQVPDDPQLAAKRQAVIDELGRPLTPNEAFNVAAGLPHDHKPPEPPKLEPLTVPLHPEEALRRQAAG